MGSRVEQVSPAEEGQRSREEERDCGNARKSTRVGRVSHFKMPQKSWHLAGWPRRENIRQRKRTEMAEGRPRAGGPYREEG